jgi:hypothetical protein
MEWRNLPFWISMQCKNNTGKTVPCHIEKVAAALNKEFERHSNISDLSQFEQSVPVF